MDAFCPVSAERLAWHAGMGRARPSPVAHLLQILIGHIDFEL
jgi:hypothetical protein